MSNRLHRRSIFKYLERKGLCGWFSNAGKALSTRCSAGRYLFLERDRISDTSWFRTEIRGDKIKLTRLKNQWDESHKNNAKQKEVALAMPISQYKNYFEAYKKATPTLDWDYLDDESLDASTAAGYKKELLIALTEGL